MKPNNESNRTQKTLRLPEELNKLIGSKAKSLGISVNAFILNAIWQAVKN